MTTFRVDVDQMVDLGSRLSVVAGAEIVAGVQDLSAALRGEAGSYRGSDQGMAVRLASRKG